MIADASAVVAAYLLEKQRREEVMLARMTMTPENFAKYETELERLRREATEERRHQELCAAIRKRRWW